MREIKIEVMFEVHNSDFTKKIAKHYTSVDRLTSGQDKFKYNEVDIIAKRQFTGLQDNNGVDIYEGDVVSQKLNCLWDEGRHNLEVRFNHDQFQTGNVKSYSSLYSAVQSFDAEIIGNIHENPELLESVK